VHWGKFTAAAGKVFAEAALLSEILAYLIAALLLVELWNHWHGPKNSAESDGIPDRSCLTLDGV